jgi:uncharacterized membrane protein
MDMDAFVKRLWSLWIALPATMLNYWIVGSRLPTRIAMHYDASGQAVSWATPQEARAFALKVLVFVLVVVTGVGYLVANSRPDRARPALAVLYVAVCLVWALLNGFVWFNLG